jgi:hypothetical protein
MSNSKTLFFGTTRSDTDDVSIEASANKFNEIYIEIESQFFYTTYVCLDRKTAIHLVKILKKEIGNLSQND